MFILAAIIFQNCFPFLSFACIEGCLCHAGIADTFSYLLLKGKAAVLPLVVVCLRE